MAKRSPPSTPPPKTTSSPSATPNSATPSKRPKQTSTLSDLDKVYLMQRAMDLAYKSLPFSELSQELGVSESRLKDQFKPNRSNLRKMVEQMFSRGA